MDNKKTKCHIVISIFVHCICVLLMLMTFALIWSKRYYGNIGLDEIFFHINMPFKGTSKTVWISILKNCLCPTILCEIIHILIWIKMDIIVKWRFIKLFKYYFILILVWSIGIIFLLESVDALLK